VVFAVCNHFFKYHQQYDSQIVSKIATGWSQTSTTRMFLAFLN